MRKGTHHSDETKSLMSSQRRGVSRRSPSLETIEKIRASNLGKKRSEETVQRTRESRIGKHPSDNARENMSISQRKVVHTVEWGRRISESKMGHVVSQETKKKLSDLTREYFEKHQDARDRLAEKAASQVSSQQWSGTKPERLMEQMLIDMRVSHKKQQHIGITVPDFVVSIGEMSLAIYVDGCYWHGCPKHSKRLSAYQVARQERDRRQESYLNARGVRWIRFWECEIQYNAKSVCEQVECMMKECGKMFVNESDRVEALTGVERVKV